MARREERAYREYVSDEQRSQAGCIDGQSGTLIRGRVLSPRLDETVVNRRDRPSDRVPENEGIHETDAGP